MALLILIIGSIGLIYILAVVSYCLIAPFLPY